MRKIIFVIIFFLGSYAVLAQGSIDALRYSSLWQGGNARYMSMGGAFGALGANTSVMGTNPAGIGLYNNPEFNITPSILYTSSESIYNGEMGKDSRLNAGLASVGLVLTKDYLDIKTHGKWKNIQFGFAMNQLKNFNRRSFIVGKNLSNSIADMYAELANGIDIQDIEEDPYGEFAYDLNPAWWSYLFSNVANTNLYYSNSPPGGVYQSKLIESWGSMNEVNVSFGANYDDKLYLGASIGIPYFNYKERTMFREEALREDIPDTTFRAISVQDRLDAQGTGFNLKLGAIYRATTWLRLGLAVHTPTYFAQIQDEWDATISSKWDSYDNESNASDLGFYEYNLTTPFKAMASVAFIFANHGLISADYEIIDYSSSKLKAPDYGFVSENNDIKSLYTTTSNLRLGTEWRAANFSFRGGFSYYGSPYKNSINDGSATSYSFGVGFKEKNYYIDIAWVTTTQSEDYYLYGYNNINTNKAVNDLKYSQFMLTYGFRF